MPGNGSPPALPKVVAVDDRQNDCRRQEKLKWVKFKSPPGYGIAVSE
jgi:hypothetical protein